MEMLKSDIDSKYGVGGGDDKNKIVPINCKSDEAIMAQDSL